MKRTVLRSFLDKVLILRVFSDVTFEIYRLIYSEAYILEWITETKGGKIVYEDLKNNVFI